MDTKKSIDWSEVHRRLTEAQAKVERGFAPDSEEAKGILSARAQALAREPEPERPQAYLDIIEFLLAEERYGIESAYVREVYPLKELTRVPCTPAFVLGITSVRGRITSVIDLKKFFDLPEKGLTELDKIIIVQAGEMELGIRADAVLGGRRIPEDGLQAALPTLTAIRQKYLKGVSREGIVILDAVKLLSDEGIIVNEEVGM